MSAFDSALDAWRVLLGDDHVITDSTTLQEASTATFATKQTIPAVIRPNSTEQVSECLKIANRFRIAVYPVSRGKNWGLGSKVPTGGNSVLMELYRMNRILDFDEEMATVTLEPGVSFRQLHEYLEGQEADLMMESVAATGEASVIGNTVERGQGMGHKADFFQNVCGFEVVLPDGEVIQTGYEGFEHSALGKLGRSGVGPFVDGLFTQSNLGIITRMTYWLQPLPRHFQTVSFHMSSLDQMAKAVNALRKLRMGGLRFSLRIFNDYRMISSAGQYPWDLMEGKTPLDEKSRTGLRASMGSIGQWVGLGGLYSQSEALAVGERALVEEALSPLVDRLGFFDEESVRQRVEAGELSEKQAEFLFSKSLMLGNVTEKVIDICYWRKKTPIPEVKEVNRDNCGLLWFCPAIPCRGADAKKLVEIAESIFAEFNFEPNLGFIFISERTLEVTGALIYDREVEGEDKRARACHDKLMDAFIREGYSPYRLGVQSMGLMEFSDPGLRSLMKRLKAAIDPNHILAPGRYT